jgi:hypothetical protein
MEKLVQTTWYQERKNGTRLGMVMWARPLVAGRNTSIGIGPGLELEGSASYSAPSPASIFFGLFLLLQVLSLENESTPS